MMPANCVVQPGCCAGNVWWDKDHALAAVLLTGCARPARFYCGRSFVAGTGLCSVAALSCFSQAGPCCAQAGAFRIGDTAGTLDNIAACKLHRPGSVGFVSKSGGMSNEMYNVLSRTTDGLYEGDPPPASTCAPLCCAAACGAGLRNIPVCCLGAARRWCLQQHQCVHASIGEEVWALFVRRHCHRWGCVPGVHAVGPLPALREHPAD